MTRYEAEKAIARILAQLEKDTDSLVEELRIANLEVTQFGTDLRHVEFKEIKE